MNGWKGESLDDRRKLAADGADVTWWYTVHVVRSRHGQHRSEKLGRRQSTLYDGVIMLMPSQDDFEPRGPKTGGTRQWGMMELSRANIWTSGLRVCSIRLLHLTSLCIIAFCVGYIFLILTCYILLLRYFTVLVLLYVTCKQMRSETCKYYLKPSNQNNVKISDNILWYSFKMHQMKTYKMHS